jgi:alcohol dehydrogenase YqhD (iron-dependent ADH family)
MVDFTYYTPTEVAFGKNAEEQIAQLVKKYGGTKVLVHYGGKSAVRSGLIDKVCGLLQAEGIPFVQLGGVVPNPRVSLVRKGIELCRQEGVDFILAVGGGSVIDSAKAIGYGLPYEGDVWDFFEGTAVPKACYPVGAVVTIPAAGSEMSDSCVISDDEKGLKRGVNNNIVRCKFAVMNPERTYTLPPYQTACGATDIMMHTMERYFSKDVDMTLTDEIAEALMRNVKDSVFYVLKNPNDYRHRAQIMWAGSLSHNDLTGCGTRRDFASHKLEHEISALFDVAHGAGLAAIWGSWARYVMNENVSRFVRFAVNVMGVANDYTDAEGTALRGIEAMERFYRAIGMPTCLSELLGRTLTDAELDQLASQCSKGGTITIGGFKVLHEADMRKIYSLANK